MSEIMLLKKIIMSDWIDVKAMVTPSDFRPSYSSTLLDVVFTIADGKIALTSEAHCLPDSWEEVFSLAVHDFIKEGWGNIENGCWTEDDQGRTRWMPRHLSREWESQSLQCVLTAPRIVRFYTSKLLRMRKDQGGLLLDDCAAVEFVSGTIGQDMKSIVLATSNYPCNLEMGVTKEKREELLSGLDLMELDIGCRT